MHETPGAASQVGEGDGGQGGHPAVSGRAALAGPRRPPPPPPVKHAAPPHPPALPSAAPTIERWTSFLPTPASPTSRPLPPLPATVAPPAHSRARLPATGWSPHLGGHTSDPAPQPDTCCSSTWLRPRPAPPPSPCLAWLGGTSLRATARCAWQVSVRLAPCVGLGRLTGSRGSKSIR